MSGAPDSHPHVLDRSDAAARTARGAAVRAVAYGLSALLSVASAAVVLRYLGVEDYGRYVTVFALVAIVGGVTEAGTANVGTREFAVRPPGEHDRLLATLQGVRLTLTVVGLVPALAFGVLAGFSEAMILGTALGGAGLILGVAATTTWVPLQAALELPRVAALELLRQALTVVALGVLVLAGAGVAVLLGAQIPVAIALAVAGLGVGRLPARSLRPAFDPAAWRRLLADTLPYALATAIGLVYSSSVLLAMSIVADETQTGLYGAASRVFVVLAGTAGVLVGSALPVLARAGRDDHVRLRNAVQRLTDSIAVVVTGLALVTAAGAAVAIDVVAGGAFDGATPVLRLLAPALVASYFLTLAAFVLLALGRQRVLIVVNGAGLAIAVVLALALTPRHGAEGGAVAALVGECAIAALSFGALARERMLPSARVAPRVALAAAAAAVPGFALGLPGLPAAALAAIVYGAAVWVLGIVPRDVLRAVTQASSPVVPGAAAPSDRPY